MGRHNNRCGGDVLTRGGLSWCDVCEAFSRTYEHPPSGTDKEVNEHAWSEGDLRSPTFGESIYLRRDKPWAFRKRGGKRRK